MKTLNLAQETLTIEDMLRLARQEPVLLLTPDGQTFCLAEVDDFDREVEALRGSQAFQRFLDERSAGTRRIPLEELEAEIEQELVEQRRTTSDSMPQ